MLMMTLEQFMAREVVSDELWREWCDVRNALKPDDRWRSPEDMSERHPALRTMKYQGPTPEYERKKALSKEFDARIRDALLQSSWKITGRINSKPRRVDIENRDVLSSEIKLAENRIGIYHDVEISRIATSPQSFLQSKIEDICIVVSPGEALKKEVIESILASLFPDKASTEHFRAAWKDANIADAWRMPGRRTGSKAIDS